MPDVATAPACTHVHIGGDCILLVPGPSHEYRREDAGIRWCFGCRAHLPHTDVLLGDPPEVLSYYDPVWVRRCSRCGKDRTDFPGTRY